MKDTWVSVHTAYLSCLITGMALESRLKTLATYETLYSEVSKRLRELVAYKAEAAHGAPVRPPPLRVRTSFTEHVGDAAGSTPIFTASPPLTDGTETLSDLDHSADTLTMTGRYTPTTPIATPPAETYVPTFFRAAFARLTETLSSLSPTK